MMVTIFIGGQERAVMSALLFLERRSIYPCGAGAALIIEEKLSYFAATARLFLFFKFESMNQSIRTITDLNMLEQT